MSKATSPTDLLAQFAKKEPKKASADAPVLNDPKLAELVDTFVTQSEEAKSLEASMAVIKGELRKAAYPLFVESNQGAGEFKSSIKVAGVTSTVMMTFNNGYRSAPGPDAIEVIEKTIPAKAFNALFEDTFSFAIDSAKVPDDKRTKLIEGLLALREKLDLPDAAITVKAGKMPVKEFNQKRMALLNKKQNLALDESLTTPTMIKAVVG